MSLDRARHPASTAASCARHATRLSSLRLRSCCAITGASMTHPTTTWSHVNGVQGGVPRRGRHDEARRGYPTIAGVHACIEVWHCSNAPQTFVPHQFEEQHWSTTRQCDVCDSYIWRSGLVCASGSLWCVVAALTLVPRLQLHMPPAMQVKCVDARPGPCMHT